MKYLKKLLIPLIIIILLIPKILDEKKENEVPIPASSTKETVYNLKQDYPNTDIVAILTIPNTTINEVVLKYTDNDYYLNHNIYKEKDKIGSIFLDYRVNIEDKKILIYGHNSRTLKTPFKELEKYYEEEYTQNNRNIELITDKGKKTYKIFSVYIATTDYKYMNIMFKDEDEWLEHLNYLKNLSMYNLNTNILKDDKILILQTCSFHPQYKKYKDKYLIIIAKEMNTSN